MVSFIAGAAYEFYCHHVNSDLSATPQVEKAHGAFVERIIEGTAERIRTDIENGRIAPLDAGETARALILMSEGFLNQKFGREPRRDWRPAADTLATIWLRALYGVAEPRAS